VLIIPYFPSVWAENSIYMCINFRLYGSKIVNYYTLFLSIQMENNTNRIQRHLTDICKLRNPRLLLFVVVVIYNGLECSLLAAIGNADLSDL